MELDIEQRDAVTIVRTTGDINAASCGRLEEQLTALIGQGHQRMVLDLGEVRYVSSAGLRVFLLVAKKLATAGGAFALSRATEPVRQVLEMTGFSSIINVQPELESAIQAVSA